MTSDYKELLEVLNACGVRYLIVGGYAVMMYTEPRFTKDLDLWLAADLENAERAYMAGDLPALTYVTLQSAVLNRQSEISDLRQSLWNDAIALSSVLGTQIQPVIEMKEPVP